MSKRFFSFVVVVVGLCSLFGAVPMAMADDLVNVTLSSFKNNNQFVDLFIDYNGEVEYDDHLGVGEQIRIDTSGGELNCTVKLGSLTPGNTGRIVLQSSCEPDDIFQVPSTINLARGRYRGRYDSTGRWRPMTDSLVSLYVIVDQNVTEANIQLWFTRLRIANFTLTPSSPTKTVQNFLGTFVFTADFNAVDDAVKIDIDITSSILGNSSGTVVFPVGATSIAFNREPRN
ncbi:MAG: hypothetical protein D6795_08210 [Deltaproteobacteria bacterium]|nr:MAG: hypothetical protein D6795_08210 [Deltaproteobacteria bacterium]